MTYVIHVIHVKLMHGHFFHMVPAALKADADLPAVCMCSGPNSIAKCSIDPQPDGQYAVTYIPVEVGMFDVQVKWNGKELPGE